MNKLDGELAVVVCDCRSRSTIARLPAGAALMANMVKVENIMVTSKEVTNTTFVIRDPRIRSGNSLVVKPAKGGAKAIRKRLMFATAAF